MQDIVSDSSATVSKIEQESKDDEPELSVAEQRKKYMARGIAGFVNVGNTCYMNASMQCLMASGIFISYFRNGSYKNDLKHGIIRTLAEKAKKGKEPIGTITIKTKEIKKMFKKSVTYRFRNVVVIVWGKPSRIKLNMFREAVGAFNPMFGGTDQNDSQEFIGCLLDRIHEETKTDVVVELRDMPDSVVDYMDVKEQYNKLISDDSMTLEDKIKYKEDFLKYRNEHLKEDAISKSLQFWQKHIKKNHSVIIDVFTSLYMDTYKCGSCNITSFAFQPENILPLGLGSEKSDISIYECLDNHFTHEEILTGDDSYHCSYCDKKTTSVKKVFIWHSSPLLIIQLKRFFNVGAMCRRTDKIVQFPMNGLNMGQYSSEYNKTEQLYDLYGVVHQSGSLRFGHYIAYVKNMMNGMWYQCNDASVLHIDDSKIHELVQTSEAYLLFYKKRGDTKITSFADSDGEVIDLT